MNRKPKPKLNFWEQEHPTLGKYTDTRVMHDYAMRAIDAAGLTGKVIAGVYIDKTNAKGKREVINLQRGTPAYDNRRVVTVLDEMAWFDCNNYADIDRAVRVFVETYKKGA